MVESDLCSKTLKSITGRTDHKEVEMKVMSNVYTIFEEIKIRKKGSMNEVLCKHQNTIWLNMAYVQKFQN